VTDGTDAVDRGCPRTITDQRPPVRTNTALVFASNDDVGRGETGNGTISRVRQILIQATERKRRLRPPRRLRMNATSPTITCYG
jgi:hypothetical protein